jgi:hypothetical protein
MPRPHVHPLNRWATVDPAQREACRPIARALCRTDVPIRRHIDTVLEYERLALEMQQYQHIRKQEALEIDFLSWKKALTQALQELNHPSPLRTPELILEIACHLHRIPVVHYGLSSHLLLLAGKADRTFGLAHLTRLHAAMFPYRLSDANRANAAHAGNDALVQLAVDLVCVQGFSPKKLEVDLAKRRGSSHAGRPIKSCKLPGDMGNDEWTVRLTDSLDRPTYREREIAIKKAGGLLRREKSSWLQSLSELLDEDASDGQATKPTSD